MNRNGEEETLTMSDKIKEVLEKLHFKSGLPINFVNDSETHIAYSHANGDGCVDEAAHQLNQMLIEARIDELENLYLKDVHFGCDKNDEEFVVGVDPKDQCCYCYPHKSCVAYKGYEALEKVIKDRISALKAEKKEL